MIKGNNTTKSAYNKNGTLRPMGEVYRELLFEDIPNMVSNLKNLPSFFDRTGKHLIAKFNNLGNKIVKSAKEYSELVKDSNDLALDSSTIEKIDQQLGLKRNWLHNALYVMPKIGENSHQTDRDNTCF